MGAMKPDQEFSRKVQVKLRSIDISHYVARTRFEDIIQSTSLEFNVGFTEDLTAQVKVPYTWVRGNLNGWTSNGLGDISLSVSQTLVKKRKYSVVGTLGAKFPTNDSDIPLDNGRPLPMYFQTSLGTYDFIAGFSLISRGWLVAVAYQKPFGTNGNTFTHLAWEGPFLDLATPYPESLELRRSGDVMLRVERNFRFSRWNAHVGLLPIYHLKRDLVTSPETGERIRAENSDGIALSLILGLTYRFNVKSAVHFLFGDRWLERDNNPDGLSREQVYSIGYRYNF